MGVHCHNDFGLAVACSLAAAEAGAARIDVCVNAAAIATELRASTPAFSPEGNDEAKTLPVALSSAITNIVFDPSHETTSMSSTRIGEPPLP